MGDVILSKQQEMRKENDEVRDTFLNKFLELDLFTGMLNKVQTVRTEYAKKENDIKNMLFLVHNKVVDIDKELKDKDLYLFVREIPKIKFIGRSNIGLAILNDFTSRMHDASILMEDYVDSIEIPETSLKPVETGVLGKIKAFFRKMPFYNKPVKPALPNFDKAEEKIDEYQKKCEGIENYTIENDLLESMVLYKKDYNRDNDAMKKIIDGEIKPMFEKMGISYLIPQYEKTLISNEKEPEKQNDSKEEHTEIKKEKLNLAYDER